MKNLLIVVMVALLSFPLTLPAAVVELPVEVVASSVAAGSVVETAGPFASSVLAGRAADGAAASVPAASDAAVCAAAVIAHVAGRSNAASATVTRSREKSRGVWNTEGTGLSFRQ